MKCQVLASGSKGNSYILHSQTGSLLLEAGIHWKQILQGLNYNLSNVVGCLITHEHLDHSKAINEVLTSGIDVYTSKGTAEALNVKHYRLNTVKSKDQFQIGDFLVLAFDTEHDAEEPLGYLIQYVPTKEKLLFLTDSFYSRYKFKGLKYICIECNYIKETLDKNIEEGHISMEMKPRLLQSHFSLENVKKFLQANDLSQCQEIILLHLSSINANAEQMIREIKELTGIIPKIAHKGLVVELNKYPY